MNEHGGDAGGAGAGGDAGVSAVAGDGGTSAALLADYVAEVLDTEHERGKSIESRGRAVISTAGALVTLLLALAAVAAKTSVVAVPGGARAFVGVAVGLFALSAVLAVATAVPQTAHLVNPATFGAEIRGTWTKPTDSVLKRITATRLQEITGAQRANTRRAFVLLVAVAVEVLAVLLLAAAVIWTITG